MTVETAICCAHVAQLFLYLGSILADPAQPLKSARITNVKIYKKGLIMRPTPDKMSAFIAQLRKKMNLKSLVVTLAAIVVFTTTYLLILPAFTLDKEEAAEQGGIDVAVEQTVEDQDAEKVEKTEEAPAEEAQAVDAEDNKAEEKAEPEAKKEKAKSADKDDSADKKDAEEKSSVKLLKGKKTITAEKADGDDFEVSAVVDGNAKLPEDVFITATELNKDTEGFDYEQYKKDVLEALKKDSSYVEEIKSIRFYDISLESESQDDTVEPEAPVNVKIEYEDGMKVDSDDVVHIIHFAEQKNGEVKAEVLDTEENKVEAVVDEKESKLSEASFDADGFSVYAVVSTVTNTQQNLSGKTYAIVNTYTHDSVQDTALSNTALNKIRVTVNSDGQVAATGNAADEISTWTFTHAPNQANNVYYIQNAAGQYIHINGNNDVSLSNTAQALTVTLQTRDNQVMAQISRNNIALNDFSGGDLAQGISGYTASNNDNNNWFRLYELDDIEIPQSNITVHYVDTNGDPIAGDKNIADTTKVDGATNYTDPYAFGFIYDLYQKIDGYAYQSTHLNSPTGTQINAEVVYKVADSYTTQNNGDYPNPSTAVDRPSYNWEYQEPNRSHGSSGAPYNVTAYDLQEFGNVSNVYVVYDKGEEVIPSHGGGGSGDIGDLDEPKPVKELKPNGDGTYELSLNVKASSKTVEESNGANIILIFDMSASMGTRIADGRTRLEAAKEAARGVSTNLLSMNTQANPELVEMMVIPFNANVQTPSQWLSVSGNNSAQETRGINGFINGLNSNNTAGGTNWEAALERAKTEADNHKDGDDTYVIFMTDGNPWMNNMQSEHDTFSRDFFEKGAYFYATEPARQIVKSGYEIYGIGIYGNVDVLHLLMNFAYNGRSTYDPTTNAYGHFFIAQNQDDLVDALSDIAGTISGKLSMAGVDLKDGVALDTTHTSLTTGGQVHGVSYSKSGGTTASFTVRVAADGKPMFSINGGAEREGQTVSKQYTKINPDGTTSPASKEIYRLTVGNNTYEMAIASLNVSGDLDWDLSPLEQLEDGATYTITTTVWPDQEAYDLVTDLNNGVATWDDENDEEVWVDGKLVFYRGGATLDGTTYYDNIVKYPDDTYAALSNTYQTLDYFVVETENGQTTYKPRPTIKMPYPDPMGLVDNTIKLKKDWDKSMMPGAETPADVTVGLLRNDEEFIPDILLKASENWETTKYIAPGIMITREKAEERGIDTTGRLVSYNGGTDNYVIINEGYDYKFTEDYQRIFQLEERIYHPMLVSSSDGTSNELIDVKIDGTTVTPTGVDISQGLVATNHLKGGININKIVKDASNNVVDSTELFDVDVTLNVPENEDGEPDFSNVERYLDNDGHVLDYSVAWYAYYVPRGDGTDRRLYDSELINLGILTECGTDSGGYPVGYGENRPQDRIETYGSGWFMLDFDNETGEAKGTVKILPGYTLRFTNMAEGTTYSAVETPASAAGYEVSYAYEHQKYKDGAPDGPPIADTGDTHAVAVNQGNNVTVTNKQVKSDLIIIKSDEQGNAITSADDTAEFELLKNTAIDGSGSWVNAVDADDNPQLIVNGKVTINSTNGVELKGLANGLYKLTETKAPEGYVIVEGSVTFKLENGKVTFVNITETGVEEIDPLEGYTITEKTATIPVKITVANPSGTPLPHTGGIGTTIFYILGSLLAVGCGIVLIARRRAGISR